MRVGMHLRALYIAREHRHRFAELAASVHPPVRYAISKGIRWRSDGERTFSRRVLEQLGVDGAARDLDVSDDRAPDEAVLDRHLCVEVVQTVSSSKERAALKGDDAPDVGAAPGRAP